MGNSLWPLNPWVLHPESLGVGKREDRAPLTKPQGSSKLQCQVHNTLQMLSQLAHRTPFLCTGFLSDRNPYPVRVQPPLGAEMGLLPLDPASPHPPAGGPACQQRQGGAEEKPVKL